ncbi:putative NADP(+)-dependent dehydrogenase [Aureobasidium subglaciale]|nr:putative NADP(+)-dependent dehydrogenase [Aureobasidium subglaciale]
MTYNILISGTTKGLGRAFVAKYLSRPNTTVIATEAQALHSISKAEGSNLIVVKVESRSDTDCISAIDSLHDQGISHLDVVIANAGFYTVPKDPAVAKITAEELLDHVNVNAAGPVRLFQATLPLLKAAEKPIFVYISSMAGSIAATGDLPLGVGVYGASKAAGNFLVRRIHQENPELTAFAMHPGAVKTEGGLVVSEDLGMLQYEEFFTTLEKSIDGMVGKKEQEADQRQIDNATRENSSGKFLCFDDTLLEW